jgi:hypothetical protein
MRNVGEHIEEYVVGKGHDQNVQRSELQVSSWDGSVFNWLGVELDIDVALKTAEELFEAVKLSIPGTTLGSP